MKKVIVIGGGFAGLSVVQGLSKSGKELEIVLIDRKNYSDFLPMLPDIIGRGIRGEFLRYPIKIFCKSHNAQFINSEVTGVDLKNKTVFAQNEKLNFDYLVIACGSETNFYGNNEVSKFAYKLDDVDDAGIILEAIEKNNFENFIISGAGYTGVEIATNLRIYFKKRKLDKKIVVVEKSASLLGSLPEWMKNYVADNFKQLNIEIMLNNSIANIDKKKVVLADGKFFDHAMLIWAAGVKIPDFTQAVGSERTPQGRIKTDDYLKNDPSCFVIGDAANFISADKPIRMAVQFSIAQGQLTARNIISSLKGRPLKKYRPLDLGYVIPMANNRSCGKVLGFNLTGFLATFFHYSMCVYRSVSARNKLGIICNLLGGVK